MYAELLRSLLCAADIGIAARVVQEKLASMPQEWWDAEVQHTVSADIGGRERNLHNTKPGVQTMFLLFSTRDADRIWELPLYAYFKDEIEPLLKATIGSDALPNIVRLQLARMTNGAHIRPHRDAGAWAQRCGTDPFS